MNELVLIDDENIQNKIFTIRGLSVMLDRDLAELYQVENRVLNQSVKRNITRFPVEFMFQLTKDEFEIWKSQIVISNSDKMGLRKLPYVFTEQGVSMLSAVLKSEIAIAMSIKIINSFVSMRKNISDNTFLSKHLEVLEHKQCLNDDKFEKLFSALEDKTLQPKQGIFYDGQVYDAYVFVTDLIKSAKKSIVLIDNYIDESVLTMLSKRDENVSATIHTKNISKQLLLDLEKHNAQYPNIEIKKFDSSHDRFLILDDSEVYHIGASLKDLGKKWFAFSRLDVKSFDILKRL